MIDPETLNEIEARCDAPLVEWQAIHADVRLLLAEVRAQQQAPAPDEMFMTRDEWAGLSAESRHKLNKWVNEINESARLLSGAGDDIERLQSKLDRISNWCKLQPVEDEMLVAASSVRKVLGEIQNIISEGDQS